MTQIPAAGQWLEAQRGLLHAWQQAQNEYRSQQANLLNQYGFTQGGGVSDNPTGLYQQLNQGEGQQVQQADQAIQQRGFNSNEGFGASLMDPLRNQQGVADSQFMRNFLGQMHGLYNKDMNAYQRFQQGMWGIQRNAAQQGIKLRQFQPAAPVPWQYGQRG